MVWELEQLREIAQNGGTDRQLKTILIYRHEKYEFAMEEWKREFGELEERTAEVTAILDTLDEFEKDLSDMPVDTQRKVSQRIHTNHRPESVDVIGEMLEELTDEAELIHSIIENIEAQRNAVLAQKYADLIDSQIYERNRTLVDLYCHDPEFQDSDNAPRYTSVEDVLRRLTF